MEGPERGELNLEGAHLPCSKIKKDPFHLSGFQGESIPSPKQQVPEFHSPRPWEFTSPLQRIPQSPITWFFRTSQRLSLLSSSFGHRKSLLGRGLERTPTSSNPTDAVCHTLHSTHNCPNTTRKGQHLLLPDILQGHQSRVPGCQHLFL